MTSAPNYARELHPPLHRQTDRILVSIVGGACIWRGTLNSLTHWRQRRVRGMHDDLFHFRNNYLSGAPLWELGQSSSRISLKFLPELMAYLEKLDCLPER